MNKLIGPAGILAGRILPAILQQQAPVKLLFTGSPGVGKTSLADTLALALCGTRFGIETANGRNVTIHVVRDWMADVATSSLFGSGWKVKLVNEVDTMPRDAQDALLTFLDELPHCRGFIATSNLDLDQLTERFRTRLQRFDVGAPADSDVVALLQATHPALPLEIAQHLAALAGGNVRAATLDAEAWLRTNQPGELTRLAKQFNLLLAHV